MNGQELRAGNIANWLFLFLDLISLACVRWAQLVSICATARKRKLKSTRFSCWELNRVCEAEVISSFLDQADHRKAKLEQKCKNAPGLRNLRAAVLGRRDYYSISEALGLNLRP